MSFVLPFGNMSCAGCGKASKEVVLDTTGRTRGRYADIVGQPKSPHFIEYAMWCGSRTCQKRILLQDETWPLRLRKPC